MSLVRFRSFTEPFRELADIQHDMNRIMDGLFGLPGQGAAVQRAWAPAVDMRETKDDLVVTADVPGLTDKDIHLSITADVLTIRGERQLDQAVSQEGHYRGERWWGRFERALPLPIPVQSDKVKAQYRDGVLTVRLPKAEEIKPRDIKIDVL